MKNRQISAIILLIAGTIYQGHSQSQPAIDKQDLTAENMLLWQRDNGGWPKDTYPIFMDDSKNPNNPEPPKPKKIVIDYKSELTAEQKKLALDTKYFLDATIDNNHTVKEIKHLLKAFKDTGNRKYLDGAERGIKYLFEAQYANGGWPQFYPDKRLYKHQITFNDNAMVNVMNLMGDIKEGVKYTKPLDPKFINKADTAFKKGIEIILKTQLIIHGKRTVWCAQYDEISLLPAKARNYELPSFSGSESVGIVQLLMRVKNPSAEVKQAVADAIAWLEQSKITGYKVERIADTTQPSGKNVVLVPEEGAVLWARFYDLETSKPFFCDRDGVKKNTLAEIGDERRTGYSWYGPWAQELISKDYPAWKEKVK